MDSQISLDLGASAFESTNSAQVKGSRDICRNQQSIELEACVLHV